MSYFTRIEHSPPEPAGALAPSIAARIAAGWRGLLYRRKLRTTERTLLALSDRTLKDIGVHRSEIHSLVRRGDTRMRLGRPLSQNRYD